MGVQLFNAGLTGAFQPTKPLLLSNDTLALSVLLNVSVTAAVEFYPEYTEDDPNSKTTQWYRECDEQDTGSGVIMMSQTIRTFQLYNGGNLTPGLYGFSPQFKRLAQFVRLQIRVGVGAAVAQVVAPFGASPVS